MIVTQIFSGGFWIMAVTKEQVMSALEEVYDPEIPINVVDLGLIYEVDVKEDDTVDVKMTMTAPGCPMHQTISADVRQQILGVEGVKGANVQVVWEPLWTPARLSDRAKKKLGFA
jgi:FeS assembly SUF system protein